MIIYSARHANAISGEIDIERPISEIGKEQAAKMAKRLSGVKFDFVFASPAKRALMTASIIAPGKDITLIPELYPVGNEAMDKMFQELKYSPLRAYQKHVLGDTITAMHYSQWKGILQAMKSVKIMFGGKETILIVSHAVTANIITNFFDHGSTSLDTSLGEAEALGINLSNYVCEHIMHEHIKI